MLLGEWYDVTSCRTRILSTAINVTLPLREICACTSSNFELSHIRECSSRFLSMPYVTRYIFPQCINPVNRSHLIFLFLRFIINIDVAILKMDLLNSICWTEWIIEYLRLKITAIQFERSQNNYKCEDYEYSNMIKFNTRYYIE